LEYFTRMASGLEPAFIPGASALDSQETVRRLMNLPSLRSFTSLCTLDRTFAHLAKVTGVLLVVSVTFAWMSLQTKAIVTDESAGIDTLALTWAAVIALALVGLGLFLLLRRYHWIHHVVAHGTPIKGVVQKIDVSTSRLPAEKHAPWTPRLSHTYFAVVTYDCGGVARKARLKLPSLPSNTTIIEGAEIDLLLLPSHPKSPLLRNIFQNWSRAQGSSERLP